MQRAKAPLKVWIHGFTGRMGLELKSLLEDSVENFVLLGGSSHVIHSSNLDNNPKVNPQNLSLMMSESDVVLDFSSAKGHDVLMSAVKILKRKKSLAILVGTTGLSPKVEMFWKKTSKLVNIRVLLAPNTSLGLIAVRNALRIISEKLSSKQFQVVMTESHHSGKKDKPSGTAKLLAQTINFPSDEILSIRAGGVFGEHEIRFVGQYEEVKVTHRAFSRKLFAEGALALTRWLVSQERGCYNLGDIQ